MKQEVWDYIHNSIFQKISRPNILDLGNGPGNAFFHFYHNYNKIKYIGVEEMCKQDIEKKQSLFRYYGKNDIQDYIYGQSSFDLYNYSLKYCITNVLINLNC